eukprot:PhF_6_TR44022/c0_g1_i1/m.67222/K02873/RP-L13e, RPL13; large subunit ribosomal protein L13e
MVRHNNAIQKNHFRFHWDGCQSQKGHVKTYLGQAKAAQSRRRVRQQKALRVFPRPASGALRPVSRCETIRYNMKTRLGRGFTADELRAVGLSASYARTIGISVDNRRVNKSEESLNGNVQRLKQYLGKLVVFPLKARKAPKSTAKKEKKAAKKAGKKGPAPINPGFTVGKKEDRQTATQDKSRNLAASVPKSAAAAREAPRTLSADEKKRHIFQFLRKSYRDVKMVGKREIRAKRKADKEAEDAAKANK